MMYVSYDLVHILFISGRIKMMIQIQIERFKVVLSTPTAIETLTFLKWMTAYRGIPKPNVTARQYVNMMTLLVLNSLMLICVESASKNEAKVSSTFGATRATNQYPSCIEWQTLCTIMTGPNSMLSVWISLGIKGSITCQSMHTKKSTATNVHTNPTRT